MIQVTFNTLQDGTESPGEIDIDPIVVEDALLNGVSVLKVTEVMKGADVLDGNFTVIFRGEETMAISVHATAEEMENVLEMLTTVNQVDVVKVVTLRDGENENTAEWRVQFDADVGNLPKMLVTDGRLTGHNPKVKVLVEQNGSEAALVYDGKEDPSTKTFEPRAHHVLRKRFNFCKGTTPVPLRPSSRHTTIVP